MSEALLPPSGYGSAPDHIARLRFTANEELRERLVEFYEKGYAQQLGENALFLYSEKFIRYGHPRGQGWTEEDTPLDTRFRQVERLQMRLRDRQHGNRQVLPPAEFKRLGTTEPGLLVRLRVQMDAMTAQALNGTVFLDAGHSVLVGHEIPPQRLDDDTGRLRQAHAHLLEALTVLRTRLGIVALDMVERPLKRP